MPVVEMAVPIDTDALAIAAASALSQDELFVLITDMEQVVGD